jgi:glycosyltransferase involved in cell wall biosynthesis
MTTIGGNVCIRNGFELDFCFVESIKSLLPICDVVSVCDGCSTDGTQEFIRRWMRNEPKIKLCVYDWPNPKGDPDFWVKWLNYGRSHVRADWHIQLDADEVLHENSYNEVRRFIQTPNRAARCTRWTFWRDHRHLIPKNECLARLVNRIGPQKVWMASDGAHPMGAELSNMAVDTGIEIFHYGFIRKPAAFFKKEHQLQGFFFNSFDPRLENVKQDKNWMHDKSINDWQDKVEAFTGTHPEIMTGWLRDRGFSI